MKYLIYTVFLLHSTVLVSTWSSVTPKDMKHAVNFSGKIITHQGQEYIVDNISIQGKYKQIPMIDKPEKHAEAVLNNETKQLEIQLDANPNEAFSKSYKDLDETQQIRVPSPDTLWVYQKKGRHQRLEYLEVEVISNSNQKTYHLLEPKTPIYCDAIDTAGPQEKMIPLSAIDTLTITGFSYRQEKNKNNKTTTENCAPCKTVEKSENPSQ